MIVIDRGFGGDTYLDPAEVSSFSEERSMSSPTRVRVFMKNGTTHKFTMTAAEFARLLP